MKKFIIVPKLQAYEVEAESVEEAIVKFAWEFDSDLNNYFEVRTEPYEGILQEASKVHYVKWAEGVLAEDFILAECSRESLHDLAEEAYDIYCEGNGLTEYEAIEEAIRRRGGNRL